MPLTVRSEKITTDLPRGRYLKYLKLQKLQKLQKIVKIAKNS